MKLKCALTTLSIVLVFFLAGCATTGESVSQQQCIDRAQIKDTKVLDDQTIVFYLYNGQSWLNKLPENCQGIYHNGFVYNLQVDKICNTDIITAIDTDIKCPLGRFEPYKEENK